MATYNIEIWGKDNYALADIRHICSNLVWTKTLNGAETLNFTIDLNRYEELLKNLGYEYDAFGLMEVGRNDIRIKRNGVYILGTNVYRFVFVTHDPTIEVQVQCVGYLNYYKTRYVTMDFDTETSQDEILFQVIEDCNAKTGGDYGVRRGNVTGNMALRTRHYKRKEVASLIQQMSNCIGGPDFDFTPDKLFNIYETKGTYHPNILLYYPELHGKPGNVQSFNFTRSVDGVANYVMGIGSGNGEDAVQSSAEYALGEQDIYRREKVVTWNSVSQQDTLDEHTNSVLHQIQDIIEIPTVTLKDGVLNLNEVDVGDTVNLDLASNLMLRHINGAYRIHKIECVVDDNDSESVTVSFDDLDIDTIIANQQLAEEEL